MNYGDMGDVWVGLKRSFNAVWIGRLVLAMLKDDNFAFEVTQNACNALAICAIGGHQNLAILGYQGSESSFNRKSAAALHWHANMRALTLHNVNNFFANRGC